MCCTKCGQKLPDDALFCGKCGAMQEQKNSDNNPTSEVSTSTTPTGNRNPKKKRAMLIAAIGLIIFTIAVVIFGAYKTGVLDNILQKTFNKSYDISFIFDSKQTVSTIKEKIGDPSDNKNAWYNVSFLGEKVTLSLSTDDGETINYFCVYRHFNDEQNKPLVQDSDDQLTKMQKVVDSYKYVPTNEEVDNAIEYSKK